MTTQLKDYWHDHGTPVEGKPEWLRFGSGNITTTYRHTETDSKVFVEVDSNRNFKFAAWNPHCERLQTYTKLDDAFDFATNDNPHNNYNIFTN